LAFDWKAEFFIICKERNPLDAEKRQIHSQHGAVAGKDAEFCLEESCPPIEKPSGEEKNRCLECDCNKNEKYQTQNAL
jgi:hypothetical protein